ncbi:MAG TPA: ABC transporter permease subunit [Actinocrinis sp.]|nr:ABC transporter permease subunit [Actinocrinis sp.]
MTATEVTPYRSQAGPGHDGFAQLVRSEWTKLRTVRGWVIALVLAVLLTVLFGVLTAVGGMISCQNGPDGVAQSGAACRQVPPLGPGGEAVTDSGYLVHRTLAGDGAITVRVSSLTGLYSAGGGIDPNAGTSGMTSGTQPWSKAGIIIRQSTAQGSAYAAMMVTGGNGVRMQYDFTHDIAGEPGAVTPATPRWLRLMRSGDVVTGYDSADGVQWTRVGSATLPGLAANVQVGMFAASPDYVLTSTSFGGSSSQGGPSLATGVFDHVTLLGDSAGGTWSGALTDGGGPFGQALGPALGFQQSGGAFTVTGTGDIAPQGGQGAGRPAEESLVGVFAGLIAVIVVAALFITAEYRRGLIRLTLAATPGRGRVLAAKAVAVGGAAFVVGLVAAGICLPLADHLAYNHGQYVLPISTATEVRLIVGTALMFAFVAIFALGVGTLLRRGAAAVTVGIVVTVLPYVLTVASVFPAGTGLWLARLTPAAAFAVQQTLVQYPQITASYTPVEGYFPLAPWAGLAVLGGYAALALGLALLRLRRRDA